MKILCHDHRLYMIIKSFQMFFNLFPSQQIASMCLRRRDAWWIAFSDFGFQFGSRYVEICRSQKFWIVYDVLEGCFVLIQETTRILVLCCICSASKPYCRCVGFFYPVRCARVRWARKDWFCCCICCRSCWFMNLSVLAVDSYTTKNVSQSS